MVTQTATRPALPAERVFYLTMIAVLWASVLAGFARSFFLRPLFPTWHSPHEPWFYFHGALFTAWLALLAVQASLIATGRAATHRQLGLIGFGMVPLMTLVVGVGALIAARRPGGFMDIPTPPLQFLITPLSGALMFLVLASLGLYWRRDPQTHKRLMLIATITLTEAAIARWPVDILASAPPSVPFWIMCGFLTPIAVWDLVTQRRLHPATLWAGLFVIAIGPVRDIIGPSGAWLSFAKGAVGLLG